MPVSQRELGQRLQAARDACRITQEEVAHHLRVSCSTVTQMELGNRGITGLELERLAYLFGRDMREFFAEEFHEEDALVALFRAHPDVTEQTNVVDTLRRCLALGREVTNLERLLGIDRDLEAIAAHHTETKVERLKAQGAVGRREEAATLLDLPEPHHEAARGEFQHRFVSLALEAFRQGAITRAKLQELVQMVDPGPEPLTRLLCDMELDDREEEGDVLLPKA
jgi:transcriptional regulator with XRE-family HTH domain